MMCGSWRALNPSNPRCISQSLWRFKGGVGDRLSGHTGGSRGIDETRNGIGFCA